MAEEISKAALDEFLNDTNFRFSQHYSYRSLLGKGGFGIVVEAVSKTTLENMAVKVKTREKVRVDYRQESNWLN